MARRNDFDPEGCGCGLILLILVLSIPVGFLIEHPWLLIPTAILVGLSIYGWRIGKRKELEREAVQMFEAARSRQEALRRQQEALRAEEKRRQRRIAEVARRARTTEAIDYMTGLEFEKFMAEFLAMQGYRVEVTKASGDQGVDLLLTEGRHRTAVQLKRYSRPLGNKPVQEALAGMIHYKCDRAWVIATSSFTRGAVELARSTGVRLIDGDELTAWFADAAEEQEQRGPTRPRAEETRVVPPPTRSRLGTWYPHPDAPPKPPRTGGTHRDANPVPPRQERDTVDLDAGSTRKNEKDSSTTGATGSAPRAAARRRLPLLLRRNTRSPNRKRFLSQRPTRPSRRSPPRPPPEATWTAPTSGASPKCRRASPPATRTGWTATATGRPARAASRRGRREAETDCPVGAEKRGGGLAVPEADEGDGRGGFTGNL